MKTITMHKFNPLLFGLFLLVPLFAWTQQIPGEQFLNRFQNGNRFYREGRMAEAAAQFRFAQEVAAERNDWAHALYWVIMAELALGDYGSALRDIDELEKKAPASVFARDIVYYRARVYFNQGFFEDALVLFMRYNDTVTDNNAQEADRKAAAFFWIGESLYSMGRFDDAEKFFAWVIAKYPNSPKIEVSNYRIDLIKQKKIEAELLALLRWSHEESLRNSEDYQRRIRIYEYTLNTYQRRIAELTKGGDAEAEQNIFETEGDRPPDELSGGIVDQYDNTASAGLQDNDLKERAARLEDEIQTLIRFYEERERGTQGD